MTAARISARNNTFAVKASAPGGITLETAVKVGEAKTRQLRGDGEARIDQLLAALQDERAAPGQAMAADARRRCETLADELAGLGGLFGYVTLGQAAGALCRRLSEDAPLTPETIEVFVDAARLARAEPGSDLSSLMDQLRRLACRS